MHEGDTVQLFGPGRGEDYAEPTADDGAMPQEPSAMRSSSACATGIPRLYEHASDVLSVEDLAKLDPATLL